MSGSHGDLFNEIGKLVLAAHAGQAIDLSAKSQELADRYINLGMPADTIARAIARSLGAVGISMARVSKDGRGLNGTNDHANGISTNGHGSNGHGKNGHAPARRNGGRPSEARVIPMSADAEETVKALTAALHSAPGAKAPPPSLFPSGLKLTMLN